MSVSSKISLKEGATPLSCVSVAFSASPSPAPIYYVGPTITLTNNCQHGEASAGILFQLDLSNNPSIQGLFNAAATPIQLNSINPWAPYPATFVPNLNTYVTNNGFTIEIALPYSLTTGQQIDLGYNLIGITADQLASLATASQAASTVYSIRTVGVKLTVSDGSQPQGFSIAAYPPQYPLLTLKWQRPDSSWQTLGTHQFNSWETNWSFSGPYGDYQLSGNILTIGNGAQFAPVLPPDTTAIPLTLLPFPTTARMTYKQIENASGTVNIQMPAKPAGQIVPATVVGYLRDHASGALLQSVPGLQWGTTTNIGN